MTSVEVPVLLQSDELLALATKHRRQYAAGQPFPHVVLDGVLPDEALELALRSFPGPDSDVWKEYENYHEIKLETQGEDRVPPAMSLLLYQFNSAPFLRFLEELTGIENLLPDPYFHGGGLHQIEHGGKLGIHADFSRHAKLPLHRRLNVIVYLNKDWHDEYGGHIELWDRGETRCVQRIAPLFNRMVIFSITDWAFHGHPEPLTCPEGTTRKSLALYYFTVERPEGEVMAGKKSTLYVRRPNEEVPPGTEFSRDRYTGLKVDRMRPDDRRSARETAKRLVPPIAVDAARALRRRVRDAR